MIEGDPGDDVWGMDVARFGDWATLPYTNAKVRENYSRRFRIRFPNEELPAARPLRTTPIYDRLVAENAVFGEYCRLENPLWFAPKGVEPREEVDLPPLQRLRAGGPRMPRRARRARHDGDRQLREDRGRGPRAAEFLKHVMANRVPAVGRLALSPMLNEGGQADRRFHHRPLPPKTSSCSSCSCARRELLPALVRAARAARTACPAEPPRWTIPAFRSPGPRRASCWQKLDAGGRLERDASRSCRSGRMDVGMIPALVGRVSFTGELGYEIWVRPEYLRALLRSCCSRRATPLGLAEFGMRALLCLRLEKSFGTWFREYRPIYGPYEAGLGRFVDLKKTDFIGRAAACGRKAVRRQAAAIDVRGRGGRCRRHRRRADLAGRQGDRLGDLGRVRTLRRQVARDGLHRKGIGRRRKGVRDRNHRRAPSGDSARSPPTIPRGCGCAPKALLSQV